MDRYDSQYSRLVSLAKHIGETKATILESCINPKSWTEIVKITGKTEPTIMVHLNDLKDEGLIVNQDGLYKTTDEGLEFLKLVPNFRPIGAKDRPFLEAVNVRALGIGKIKSNWKELVGDLVGPGLVARGYIDKDLGEYYKAIADALRISVAIWLPKKVEIDREMFKIVNDVVHQAIENKATLTPDGKVRIIIDVDFARALDMMIREENNVKAKELLIKNREKIIKGILANWNELFD